MREAGSALPGEPPPIVLLDLRASPLGIEPLAAIHRTRPRATIIALVNEGFPLGGVYEQGAAAAVYGDETAIAMCVRGIAQHRTDISNEAVIAEGIRAGFARLRRIVGELRSGLLSTTVSLNLMNAVAEYLERGILFVIQQDRLIPIGAFGTTVTGEPLSHVSHLLGLSLREPSALAECADAGRARCLKYDEARLPAAFTDLVGRPRSPDIAVLPISGSERVIAVIYVDNGTKDRPIVDTQVLELAAFQLGLALENEFLRRSRSGNTRRPTEVEPASGTG
jgi:hypothetical protein